ncbi:hypothetical protein [Persicitalea jodogahamensis]|uniref:Uncharacterized protein n=1 Tax=Persicitalea jodogahamensis TaxID=402147 RepID=A0A8J3DC07_9BACT|nr:hypothetical protein [Persicitalea jodogahamensis]GHB81681.1 hypothetical protein GCM10007390_40760 [Persicitalea jodogahamensis]
MSKVPASWHKLTIKFQTSEVTPPPYAYSYALDLIESENMLLVDFDQRYLDRDELDEEAILEEGFELNSDYAWKGELNAVWIKELEKLLSKESFNHDRLANETENSIELAFNIDSAEAIKLYPEKNEEFEYFLQEIMQGIYEVSGKEKPFQLEYRDIDRQGELVTNYSAEFANRNFSVQRRGQALKKLPWKWTQELMGTVFMADFLVDDATREVPKFSGKYLSFGDGLWYEFGETMVEPASDSIVLPRIDKLLNQLSEEAAR